MSLKLPYLVQLQPPQNIGVGTVPQPLSGDVSCRAIFDPALLFDS